MKNIGLLLLFILSLLLFLVRTKDLPCSVSYNGNTIASANLCTNPTSSACVNVAPLGQAPDYKCRQCYQNCDCGLGNYCIKSSGPNIGTCQPLESNILGAVCNSFDSPSDGSLPGRGDVPLKFPTYGVDDQRVCGVPVFMNNTINNTVVFQFYEWLGYCQQGICQQCVNIGQDLDQQLAFLYEHTDSSTILCPGRVCTAGILYAASFASSSITANVTLDTGVNTAILVFVIIMSVLSIISTSCVVKIWRTQNYKRMTDRI